MAKVKKLDSEAGKAVDETEEADHAEAVDAEETVDDTESATVDRTDSVVAFWEEMRIDPVEIALPKGVGFTLRAYRPEGELNFSDVDREEDDFTILDRTAADTAIDFDAIDEEELTAQALAGEGLDESDTVSDKTGGLAPDTEDAEAEAEEEPEAPAESEEEAEAEEEAETEDEAAAPDEDVPVFLGHAGWLYLFRTRQALVEFVRSDADHDFKQLDTWAELRQRLTPDQVAPDEADRYELDLVVENLRGGHEVWDADLLIRAGEIARDLGYALQIAPILSALGPESPLDDLDEALRNSQSGGFGAFLARRRLKKIGTQQAALGWRTIIGKISAAVDWRE